MFYLRDLPNYEMIRKRTQRYPEVEPTAVEATFVLLRVAVDVLAAFDVWLSRQNISQGRFSLLMLLNREPDVPMSPSDLAARAGVTRATVTGLLDILERQGMVAREHVEHDRRMVRVRLTESARAFLDSILPDYYRRVAALMAHLSEDDERQLTQLLRRVNEGISAVIA